MRETIRFYYSVHLKVDRPTSQTGLLSNWGENKCVGEGRLQIKIKTYLSFCTAFRSFCITIFWGPDAFSKVAGRFFSALALQCHHHHHHLWNQGSRFPLVSCWRALLLLNPDLGKVALGPQLMSTSDSSSSRSS